MKLAGHIVCKKKRTVHKILVGKPEEKKPLGRPRHRGRII
jgi:hypothetical protein